MRKSILILVLVGAFFAGSVGDQNAFGAINILPIGDSLTKGSNINEDTNFGFEETIDAGTSADSKISRGFVIFDLSTIPPGSTIDDVELSLFSLTLDGPPVPISLHKLTTPWNEATVTWNTPWINPGGDFVILETASQTLTSSGPWTISHPQMINDVQDWLDNPASNNGWILKRTTEPSSLSQTSIASRENLNPLNHPMLIIEFTPFDPPVGGTIIPIDSTSLILVGAQMTVSWLIPVLVAGAGIGLFVVSRKSKNS